MHQQFSSQIQERTTSLELQDVLNRAIAFFGRSGGVYCAYLERRGPTHVAMRGQGNEEVIIAGSPIEGGSAITGSTYFYDQQVALFLDNLPPL